MELLISPSIDVRLQIAAYLEERRIKQSFLYERLPCSNQHMSGILLAKRNLTAENLRKINEILGTNFKDEPPRMHTEMGATG